MIPFYRYADNCVLRGTIALPYFDVFNRTSRVGAYIDFQPMLDTEMVVLRGSMLVFAIASRISRNRPSVRDEKDVVADWMEDFYTWMEDSL